MSLPITFELLLRATLELKIQSQFSVAHTIFCSSCPTRTVLYCHTICISLLTPQSAVLMANPPLKCPCCPVTFQSFSNRNRHIVQNFASKDSIHTAQAIAAAKDTTAQQTIDPRQFHLRLQETAAGPITNDFPGKSMPQSLWTTRSVRRERERVQRLDDPRLATTAPLSEQYKRHALFHNPSLGPTTNTKLHFSALKAPKTAKRKLGRWQTPDGWRTDNDASAAHDETQQDDCSECSDERTEDGNSASNDGNAGANEGNARADKPNAAKKPNSANSQAESPCQVLEGLTKQMEQLLTLNEGPVCLRVSTDPPTFVMQSTQVVPVLPVSCCRDIHSPFSPSATLLQRHTLSSLSFRNTPPATYTLLSLLPQHSSRDIHSPPSPSATLLPRHTLSSLSFCNTPSPTFTSSLCLFCCTSSL